MKPNSGRKEFLVGQEKFVGADFDQIGGQGGAQVRAEAVPEPGQRQANIGEVLRRPERVGRRRGDREAQVQRQFWAGGADLRFYVDEDVPRDVLRHYQGQANVLKAMRST